ncbi:MAG: GGDEF domain-containing protein [Burkholderiaceae bacterium]
MMPSPPAPSPATGHVPPLEALGSLVPALMRRDGDGLSIKDAHSGVYLYVDETFLGWQQRTANDVLGRTDVDLFDSEAALALRGADQAAVTASGATHSEHRFARGGVRQDFSVMRLVVRGYADGEILASVWRDMMPVRRREVQRLAALAQLEQQQTENEQLRRELHDQGLRDGETGLYNSAHFEDQLRREVDLSTREHREFALVSIELDDLPSETAALGPDARLRTLEALGRLLRGNTRAMDASCRLDETRFAVLLSGVGLATAHSRMEGLRRQCATQIVVHEGRDLHFTVSMGVASFPHTAHSQDELRGACDAALRDARQRGGNHVTLASIRFEGG